MKAEEPKSMAECLYFTNRTLGKVGSVKAWVLRPRCPRCSKGVLGKPVIKGKVKTRAKEYVCSECSYKISKNELEQKLNLHIKYRCPFCGRSGETTTPYKRKRFMGVEAYIFVCEHCGRKIPITKRMKEIEGLF